MKPLIKNRINLFLKAFLLLLIFNTGRLVAQEENTIDLAGEWNFRIDSLNIGEEKE